MKRRMDAEQAEHEYQKKKDGSSINVLTNVDLQNTQLTGGS